MKKGETIFRAAVGRPDIDITLARIIARPSDVDITFARIIARPDIDITPAENGATIFHAAGPRNRSHYFLVGLRRRTSSSTSATSHDARPDDAERHPQPPPSSGGVTRSASNTSF